MSKTNHIKRLFLDFETNIWKFWSLSIVIYLLFEFWNLLFKS